MTRFQLIRVLAAVVGLSSLLMLCSCACECPALSIPQQDAVGTFISLSKDPLNSALQPEVMPARIRAWNGDYVVWVFRNPSRTNVTVGLAYVKLNGEGPDIKDQVFWNSGNRASVAKSCGYGWLREQLKPHVVAKTDSCPSNTFNYWFWVKAGTDSVLLKVDPELVVEGKP